MPQRRTTVREVALLKQLYEQGQLVVAPAFQRFSVWPRAAKAYLIDSILKNRPIPALLFHRTASAQSGKSTYTVIDGQQRLRAVFDFIDDLFTLTRDEGEDQAGKRFRDLDQAEQHSILNYDFVIEELSDYTDDEIKDIFTRANRYVVKLNPQEIRHAKASGKFAEAAGAVGGWSFWRENRVFTASQILRMRPTEFAAELFILLAEGPQDKKTSIDVWYSQYRTRFTDGKRLTKRLAQYIDWIASTVPDFTRSRFRKPVDLYAVVGAIDRVVSRGTDLSAIDADAAGSSLAALEQELSTAVKEAKDPLSKHQPTPTVARYLVAASRQTDNLMPRTTRIEVIETLLLASI